MKLKQFLSAGLAIGFLAAGSLATSAEAGQGDAPMYSPYTVQRNLLNLGSTQQGVIDMTGVRTTQPPVRLRLHMENPGDRNVNVTIPDFEVSYMVPGNTVREHDLFMTQVGFHNEVEYFVELLPPAQLDNFRQFTDISHILSSSYITPYRAPVKPEPKYYDSGSPVRGYW